MFQSISKNNVATFPNTKKKKKLKELGGACRPCLEEITTITKFPKSK